MKTLRKLKINGEKILKNEELVNLRGGYGGYPECLRAQCSNPYFGLGSIEIVVYPDTCTLESANNACIEKYGPDSFCSSSFGCQQGYC